MDAQTTQQYAHEFVEQHWGELVDDLGRLVAIDSVEDVTHASEGAPFGPGPRAALDTALDIAQRLGLEPHDDCEGYLGYADVAGASSTQVATIAHADIVPVGQGWDTNPLEVVRRDGYLLGRGVMDDKGGLVLSFYAAACVAEAYKKAGKELPYTLRCFVGCNEETHMKDVHWYLAHHEAPAFLFTPDADFPLIYGEKGHFMGAFVSGELGEDRRLVEISGGTVPNAVPSQAYALVRADATELLPTERISVHDAGDGLVRIEAQGIGGHASLPEGTINAIALLANYLLEHDLVGARGRKFLELVRKVSSTHDGSSLGIQTSDEAFGPLTCVAGVLSLEDGRLVQTVDSRYPTTISGEELAARMRELAAEAGASFEVRADDVPYLGDPTSEPVQALLGAYQQVTGDMMPAFTIGGGTYARHFPSACAFGPNTDRSAYPEWVGMEHGPNEGVAEADLKQALEVYILALFALMECKF